jgi:hypothetical protein
MRYKLVWWLTLGWWLVTVGIGSFGGTTSAPWIRGQAQPPAQPSPPRQLPPGLQKAAFDAPPVQSSVTHPEIDIAKLPPVAQEVYRGARSGTEWLCRVHQPNGRFLPGWLPDLNQPAEGDHFLRQAGATLALARAARVFKDDRYATRARQAVLTLMAETGPDPTDPQSRCTTLPSSVVNRVGAAGLLLACIHELPDPAPDLLDQGEQLARFIARHQLTNGAFRLVDAAEGTADPDDTNHHPGLAIYGVMRSNIRRPAPWKLEMARRALGYYATWWREHQHPTFAVGQIAAFTESFVQSKERSRDAAFADFVFEMGDWLCAQQIRQLDVRHPQWQGGFPEFVNGRAVVGAPKATGAAYAAALIDASRVTRQKPDAERYERYKEAGFAALQFVMTLQYNESNTQHFAPGYRQRTLLGGFHASPEDGALRLEDTRHAVAALSQYWEYVVTPELASKSR